MKPRMRASIAALVLITLASAEPAVAQSPPLVSEAAAQAFASELSGETAKRNLEQIARNHRTRGSRQFRNAADFVAEQLRSYGLTDARVEEFPADGSQWYGTQRARPAWNADFAELWEVDTASGQPRLAQRIASFDAVPMTLAQDSESGDVTAPLVDVGRGTAESDYAGKDVRGQLVLTSSQPGPVAELAVAKHGAVGIISYAQNQTTAWSGDDDTQVRWGHLETFVPHKTFAFMVSLRQARAFQQRLQSGNAITLKATVKAGSRPGAYSIVTATIPGEGPRASEEIAFSCHLDHPRPGANDNASGCVAILEVARTYARLIAEKRLPRPARTLRFIWPPEIEGTVTYLNARPEVTARLKAVVHLDMVGGGPETKATFHVTRGPASLPSFVNDQTMRFAGRGSAAYPLNAPEGGKEPLRAALVDFTSGSDHQVYTEGSFRIPAVYMNDWPDRNIHTTRDTAAMIDPTKLLRASFITAATGWALANLDASQAPAVFSLVRAQALERAATASRRMAEVSDTGQLARFHLWHERTLLDSMARFFEVPAAVKSESDRLVRQLEAIVGPIAPAPKGTGEQATVFVRQPEPKGPMSVFGYDYFTDKFGAARAAKLRVNAARARWGDGGYDYEILNLVDGRRTVQEITDMVSAIYGPVDVAAVLEYLRALEEIKVVALAR